MKGNKIILGEGNFGKVKLALSLSDNKSKPCDLICVKKSKKIKNLDTKEENISKIWKAT